VPGPAAGFFGKLPSAGDFVQRRLPSGFVDVWDQHFERAVAETRRALNGHWHEAYHASPAWRFMLAPTVCGDCAWAGIMGPGVDRVGRCFPMVIAAPVAADAASCLRVLTDSSRWFDAAEQVHFVAQGDASISVEAFDEQVAALASPLDAGKPDAPELPRGIDWSTASHWRLPLPVGGGTGAFLGGLWTRLAATPGHWCLWWTTGAGRMPASVLITNSLPQPDVYVEFLDAARGSTPWQSVGAKEEPVWESQTFADCTPGSNERLTDAPPAAWLPDELELSSEHGTLPEAASSTAPSAGWIGHAASANHVDATGAVLSRPDCGLTLLAAEAGHRDPRQRAVAAVLAIGQDLTASDLAAGLHVLRTRIIALNPPLRHASEDLIDPVLEDCAVIAAHVADGKAGLLRIGTAAAWHWRRGQLQPVFARHAAPSPFDAAAGDDFNDLLFNQASPTAPGLGATAQPACEEVFCAVQPGDRLLLMATSPLLQLPHEILVRSLARPSCEEARRQLADAAGLGADAGGSPWAIIEIDA
jgi:type VI secretion system protein ImpM